MDELEVEKANCVFCSIPCNELVGWMDGWMGYSQSVIYLASHLCNHPFVFKEVVMIETLSSDIAAMLAFAVKKCNFIEFMGKRMEEKDELRKERMKLKRGEKELKKMEEVNLAETTTKVDEDGNLLMLDVSAG